MSKPKCQSTSHKRAACYGVLWQCEKCKRMVCCADGTDTGDKEQDGLCDACWYEKYGEAQPCGSGEHSHS